jgi:hypothetical protein
LDGEGTHATLNFHVCASQIELDCCTGVSAGIDLRALGNEDMGCDPELPVQSRQAVSFGSRRRSVNDDGMKFSMEPRDRVASAAITVSFRLWQRPKVKVGGRYAVGPALIEIDSIDLQDLLHSDASAAELTTG